RPTAAGAATISPAWLESTCRARSASGCRASQADCASTRTDNDRRATAGSGARRSRLPWITVHRVVRRWTRTALLPVRYDRVVRRHRHVLQERAEAEGGAGLRRAGDARVRRRQVPRGDDGVSAGRDREGLSILGFAGISEPEAW